MLTTLKDCGVVVHFVLLCETFLTELNASMFPIPGYECMHKSRNTLSKGGVAIYVLMELNYMEKPDLCVNIEGEFESIAIEVKDIYDKQNAIIAEIYRVPNTNERISIERYDEFVTK